MIANFVLKASITQNTNGKYNALIVQHRKVLGILTTKL